MEKRNQRLLEFLSNPANYHPVPGRVILMETHSAWVFHASPYVYKVKKPVRLGFLDFSSLAKRRRVLERESRLNARLAPGVYLGVKAIRRGRCGLSWTGQGRTMEYALRMRRLAPGYFMDRLLERGAVGRLELDRLVRVLVAFYRARSSPKEVACWGNPSRLRLSTDENFRQTRREWGGMLRKETWQCIRQYTHLFYGLHKALFRRRVKQGWIRDGHGDLRLEHIHLAPRNIRVIDCVEFNDRLRFVDVASDVAFLAMDLDRYGRPDYSNYLVQQLARGLGDPDMGLLMDFYKCYRAFVRGKVECLQARNSLGDSGDGHEARAGNFFQLALRYAVLGSRPTVLVVMGGIATGKSSVSTVLAERLGLVVYNSDQIRKQMAGVPVHGRSEAAVRKRLYTPSMTRRSYRELFRLGMEEIHQGRSVVLDATFGRRRERDQWRRMLEKQRVSFRFLEMHASVTSVRQRLQVRETDQGQVSDARIEDWERLRGRYEAPLELGRALCLRLESGDRPEVVAQRALEGVIRQRMMAK